MGEAIPCFRRPLGDGSFLDALEARLARAPKKRTPGPQPRADTPGHPGQGDFLSELRGIK